MLSGENNFVVSLSESQFQSLTKTNNDELEDVSYALGYTARTESRIKLLVREVLDPYEYPVTRSAAYVEPDPKFVCKLHGRFRQTNSDSVVQVHWHKFSEKPAFSSLDDRCARALVDDLRRWFLGARVVQIVFGADTKYFQARYIDHTGHFTYFDGVQIIGPRGMSWAGDSDSGSKSRTQCFPALKIFEKNIMAFSEDGAQKIASICVAVIGCGGLGSGVCYHMMRMGFQNVILIDFDKVETSNCNRVYFVDDPTSAVDKYKVQIIEESWKKFNPKASIRTYVGSVLDPEAQYLLKDSDLLVLTVDNDSARAVINNFCAKYAIPLVNISTGIYMAKSGLRIETAATQIQFFIPREAEYPCLLCQGSLNYKEIEKDLVSEISRRQNEMGGYIVGTSQSPNIQVMPLNGIGVSIGCWEIAGWAAGFKKPAPWLYYDAMNNKVMKLSTSRKEECTCCGSNPMSILATGDYAPTLRGKAVVPAIQPVHPLTPADSVSILSHYLVTVRRFLNNLQQQVSNMSTRLIPAMEMGFRCVQRLVREVWNVRKG